MTMATSLALANPNPCDDVMSRSPVGRAPIADWARPTGRGAGVAPPATDGRMLIFVRRNCLEPAEGSAHFDNLNAHRSPTIMQGEPLPGQDCGSAGDDDAGD
jgi:hypothetical protein